jgi:exodeoxyribonuclease V gamma subunit
VLHIHRADRADGLIEALRDLLAEPPGDPFAPEVVSVPTRGIERWITQRLSTRLGTSDAREDGVCANVLFPSPWRLVGEAVATASGVEPESDPWLPERAVWPLLDVVDECIGEPWLRLLADHLGGDPATADPLRRSRRFATVRHVADLLDRYALHRPDVVHAWAETPGTPDDHWQAQLWRRLRARIGAPGPAERLQAACARLGDEPEVLDLPERVSLFGLTRLPAAYRDVLAALAARRDVHLFLLHPSPALWDAVAAATAGTPPVVGRAGDPTATLPANRLLASWGRDSREMQLVLAGTADEQPRVDHHHPVAHDPRTLLARIQADVRADRPPPALPLGDDPDDRPLLEPADHSLEVHACHGRARQVEVLRDAILHLLQDDPTLEPRDVIVMCPDIETFAPLIHATFGAAAPADEEDGEPPPDGRPPDLRVRLADRALRQTNPLLGVVAELLELAHGRVTASQVLDLAGRDPVRRRFRLDDDDLVRLEEWVTESGIRWGLDAAHRQPFGLDELRQGTWDHGVARVLVGVTMTEDDRRLVDGVLPLDDVESGAIDLAGRFAELVDRLTTALDELTAPKPVDAWTAAIARAADLLADAGPRDAWQRAELQRILGDVAGEAAGSPTPLALAEVRALLGERLEGRPTRTNFRTGHLTICTLHPMRSVPHRVVCLLGLDDAVFPRKAPRDGDDVLLDDPRVGERDPRAEDRQLLLDALMAAQERLLITFTGNDERTNAPRPPAVPVGELLDVADRTVRTSDGKPARERVVVRHPLQPFDPRNFTAGRLAREAPWSFDRVTLAGARALTGGRADPPPFLTEPLAPQRSPVVQLDDLVRFVQHPVRAFLRGRLGLSVGDFSTDVDDALPVDLDGLAQWDIGQRLLDARLEGCETRAAYRAEIARGHLPPGLLGKPVIERLLPTVEDLVAATEEAAGAGPGETIDVRVALDDGLTVTGTVAGVRGDALLSTTFSRVAPKHRVAAWVRLLAATASAPERPYRSVTIGKARRGDGIAVASIPPLMADAASRRTFARTRLAALVDLYDRALREPLPAACKASAAYARAARDGGDAEAAAREEWDGDYNRAGEAADPSHVLVFGRDLPFDELGADGPRDDERGPGREPAEATRFGRYAMRLWADLLDVEEVVDR